MSPRYQLPDDFFSPPSSPPRTGGYEVTEFPPREEYAVEIFDAPRKRVTSMSSSSSSGKAYKARGLYIYTRKHTNKDNDTVKYQTFYLAPGGGKGRFISRERAAEIIERGSYPVERIKTRDTQYVPPGDRPYKELSYWDKDTKKYYKTNDPGVIEDNMKARGMGRHPTLVRRSEIATIVKSHHLPSAVTNSIIRDLDHLAVQEVKDFSGRRQGGYRGERGLRFSEYAPYVGEGRPRKRTQRQVYSGEYPEKERMPPL